MSIPFCIQCTLPNSHCICDQAPLIQPEGDITILFHPRELERRNSTGRLLKHCCHISSTTWHRLKNQQLQAQFEGYSLIYPANEIETHSDIERIKPKGFLLLDATWQESRKILRQSPWLNALPKYPLKSAASQYSLRRNQTTDGLSTIESMALWLEEQNQTKSSQELLHFFTLFQDRYLDARESGLFK